MATFDDPNSRLMTSPTTAPSDDVIDVEQISPVANHAFELPTTSIDCMNVAGPSNSRMQRALRGRVAGRGRGRTPRLKFSQFGRGRYASKASRQLRPNIVVVKCPSGYATHVSDTSSDLGDEGTTYDFKRPHRSCGKIGCPMEFPVCSIAATAKCVGDGYTSRWYHISSAEHYCNDCFEYFYRPQKKGNAEYVSWRTAWADNSRWEASMKHFLVEKKVQYWVRCVSCKKWRSLPHRIILNSTLISRFECGEYNKEESCDGEENPQVAECQEPNWVASLLVAPLLQNSPAADFLGAYFPDAVGLSPTCPRAVKANNVYQESRKRELEDSYNDGNVSGEPTTNGGNCTFRPTIPGLNRHLEPFYQPSEHGKALCTRADIMDAEEEQAFPEYTKAQIMYLAIRNVIVALWNLDCKKWLTTDEVSAHVLCRGLSRIRCVMEAERILRFLTVRGTVNIGLVTAPLSAHIVPPECPANIVIIGAGISGIGAARQLKNLGFKVTVLEARNRIGGRIWDDDSFGVCVGKGAQIVTGVVNSPTTIICEQADLNMRYLMEKCDLYLSSGEVVDSTLDGRMELHFNSVLDAVATWRKGARQDTSLYAQVWDMHSKFLQETNSRFNEEQMKVFHFHLSNLEYACGVDLHQVSALYWDQNEAYEQFAGDHTMLRLGYSTVMRRLAEELIASNELHVNTPVARVDYSGDGVTVTCSSGEKIQASHVLVTVPLAVLQASTIEFVPALPKWKLEALNGLGAGVIEKVVLQFPHNFWDARVCGADFFGFVPPTEKERGRFPVFCDMSKHGGKKNSKVHILMTYLCGESANLMLTKTNEDIVAMCVNVLESIFGKKAVPKPIKYFVTRWSQDPYARMVYSYVKIGGSGESYDKLAANINGKVFFAGEATNRRFPQTVAGAYLSGLREAGNILRAVIH